MSWRVKELRQSRSEIRALSGWKSGSAHPSMSLPWQRPASPILAPAPVEGHPPLPLPHPGPCPQGRVAPSPLPSHACILCYQLVILCGFYSCAYE